MTPHPGVHQQISCHKTDRIHCNLGVLHMAVTDCSSGRNLLRNVAMILPEVPFVLVCSHAALALDGL